MFEKEEKALNDIKKQINEIQIPANIDDFILKGMQQGKTEMKKVSRWKPYKFSGLVAACLLLFIVVSIRFSPTVAAYVGQIPAFQSFVKMITNDKGLKLALENEFIQPVGVSDEHDGIRFTIDGVIADESRVLLFYTIENVDGRNRIIDLDGISFTDSKGSPLKNYGVHYGSSGIDEVWDKKEGTIDILLGEGAAIPDQFIANVYLEEATLSSRDGSSTMVSDGEIVDSMESMKETWNMQVDIDKKKFEGLKEVYNLNRTVNVEGQSVTFNSMTVYPTRIAVDIEYDPKNTKKIFGFDDIRIVDELGSKSNTIANGVTASLIDENHIILYFQSNYFEKPKNIYIKASSLRALDKDKTDVVVNVKEKKLLKAPDKNLSLIDVGSSQYGTVLRFGLFNDHPLDKLKSYNMFAWSYKDATGKEFEPNMMGGFGSGPEEEKWGDFYINDDSLTDPVTLTLVDYPTRISGDILIKVK